MATITDGATLAHGGGLNADGCHNDRKRGGYHCHRGSYEQPAPRRTQPTTEAEDNRERQTLFGGGSSGSEYDGDVETVQKLLVKLGYEPGEPDGLLGDKTRAAIRAFQSDNSMTLTGVVSQDLITVLIEKLAA